MHNSAQLRCFENGNDDFGLEAFWIGDAARVGYFVQLNGPLNGHPPSNLTTIQDSVTGFLYKTGANSVSEEKCTTIISIYRPT